MKHILAALFCLLFATSSFARGGGSAPPVCTASAPAQASAVGFTNLVFCDNFTTNQSIDTFNTLNPGFSWYIQHYKTHADLVSPNQLQNDGTGVWLSGNNNGKSTVLLGMAQIGSTSNVVGQGFANGFYAECSRKLTPTATSGEPSMWFASKSLILANGQTSGSPVYPYVEIDAFDWFGGSGPTTNVYEWIDSIGGASDAYGNTNTTPTIAGVTYTNYNTYGILWVPSTKNSGTGYFKFYLNGTLYTTVTYTPGGAPSPTTCSYQLSGSSSCPTGTYSSADNETFFMMLGTDVGGTLPFNSKMNHTIQWCHVFQ